MSYELISADSSKDRCRKRCERSEAPPQTRYDHVGESAPTYRSAEYYDDVDRCVESLFEWHTETVNAWTMILESIVCVTLFVSFCVFEDPDGSGVLFFALFLLTSAVHGIVACVFHLTMPVSTETYIFWRKADTVLATIAFFCVTLLLNFYALPTIAFAILTGLAGATQLASVAQTLTWENRFYERARRNAYVTGQMAIGLSFPVVPVVWRSTAEASRGNATPLILGVAVVSLLTIGLVVYCVGYPERFGGAWSVPAAHNIMHSLVPVVTVLVYYFALDAFHDKRNTRYV